MRVKDIMTKKVISVNSDTLLSQAADLLFKGQYNGLPVLKNGQVIGMVTEEDFISKQEQVHIPSYIKFLKYFTQGGKCPDDIKADYQRITKLTVADIITKNLVTIKADALVSELIEVFRKKHVNPVPVVDGTGKLRGIVSRADVVRLFSSSALFKFSFRKRTKLRTLADEICRTFARILSMQKAALFISNGSFYKIEGTYHLVNKKIRQTRLRLNSKIITYLKHTNQTVVQQDCFDAANNNFKQDKTLHKLNLNYFIPLRSRTQRRFIGFIALGASQKAMAVFSVQSHGKLLADLSIQAGAALAYIILKNKLAKEQSASRQSREINHYLLKYIKEGVILINHQNDRIITINQALKKILSLKQEGLIGKKIKYLIKKDSSSQLSSFLSLYQNRKSKRRSFHKNLFNSERFRFGRENFILNSGFVWGLNKKKIGELIIIEKTM